MHGKKVRTSFLFPHFQSHRKGYGCKNGSGLSDMSALPAFFAGWAKVLGLHPHVSIPRSVFLRALTRFANFSLQRLKAYPHFFAGRTKVLDPYPQLCCPAPSHFLRGGHAHLPPLEKDMSVHLYSPFPQWIDNRRLVPPQTVSYILALARQSGKVLILYCNVNEGQKSEVETKHVVGSCNLSLQKNS